MPGPDLCVGAVVVLDGALLLVQRAFAPGAGEWSVPGGRVELGETLVEAVVRELAEETGLAAEEVTFEPGFWMAEDDKRCIFVKMVRSPLAADDLRQTILNRLAREAEPELADIHIVRDAQDLVPDRMPPFQLAHAQWWLAGGGRA
jgi:ADP-ribose pyrophosphatase YjhB (NUDIX family)